MSNIACSLYGINSKMFSKVCPGKYVADAEGFARIYIGGLQSYVLQLESQLAAKNKEISLLNERLQDKDNIIQLLTPRDGTVSL